MATPRPFGVLGHHLAEEERDLIQARVLRVAHILAAIVSGLQRVVLNGNKVEGHVVETRFTRGQATSYSSSKF